MEQEGERPLATALAERGNLRPRARVGAGGFVGPFTLVRELARAPGAWLFEGRDTEEKPILIHIAGLRAAPSEAERIERTHYEHAIASATKALLIDPDPTEQIICHGAADEIGGRRILFWALHWPAKFGSSASSWHDLAAIGLAVAKQLDRRHKLGQCEPQLTEHSLLVSNDRDASRALGAPIVLASDWLCHRTIATRFAPEEAVSKRPGFLGDLWRLGQALRTMAAALDDLPPPFEHLLSQLTAIDPRRRPQRASETIVEFEALLSQTSTNITVSFGAMAPERFEALIVQASGDSTRVEPASPLFEVIEQEHDQTRQVITLIPPFEVSPTAIVTSAEPASQTVRLLEEIPQPTLPPEPDPDPEIDYDAALKPPPSYYWMTIAVGFVSGVLAWVLFRAV